MSLPVFLHIFSWVGWARLALALRMEQDVELPIPAVQELDLSSLGASPCVLDSCCKSWCKAEEWLTVCTWGGCELCNFCFPGITHKGEDATKIPNLQTKLIPPAGIWRGGTHWIGKGSPPYDPASWQTEFGVPLHIMRLFKAEGKASNYTSKSFPGTTLTADELAFAEEGGILWYGWQASTRHHGEGGWAEWFPADGADRCVDDKEKKLKWHARAVRSLAPALVMVAPGWEPDGHTGPPVGVVAEDSHEYFGTYTEYIKQYEHAQKRFAQYGAYNAVWIIDFSHKATWDPPFRPVIKELIPPKIDWIFWNMFQTHSNESYANFTKNPKNAHKVTAPVSAKVALDGWLDVLADVPQAQGKPWGLGAWGSNARQLNPTKNKYGTKGTLIPKSDRQAFLKDTADWLTEHQHKVKASIYFDSLDSLIAADNASGVTTIASSDGKETLHVVQNKADLANNFENTNFKTSSELFEDFKTYNHALVFTVNDS